MGFKLVNEVKAGHVCQFKRYNKKTKVLELFELFGTDMIEKCQDFVIDFKTAEVKDRDLAHSILSCYLEGHLVIVSEMHSGEYEIYTVPQIFQGISDSMGLSINELDLSLPCFQYDIKFIRDTGVASDGSIMWYGENEDLIGFAMPFFKGKVGLPDFVLTLESIQDIYSKFEKDDERVTYLIEVNGVPVTFISIWVGNDIDKTLVEYQNLSKCMEES